MKKTLKRECLYIVGTLLILALMTWVFVAFNNHLVDICRQDKPIAHTDVEPQKQTTILQVTATAYSNHYKCTGKTPSHPAYGITYSGTKATEGRTIAVDKNIIPLGSTVIINGQAYIAEDTGRLIKGNRIDMFFDNYNDAKEFGVKILEIEVMK